MNKKRKIMKIAIYLAIIIPLLIILILQKINYLSDEFLINIFIGDDSMTDRVLMDNDEEGCDLSTHHLEYNKETKKTKCMEGSENPNPPKYKYCDDFTREITKESNKCIQKEFIK